MFNKKNKKGQVAFYILFIFIAITMVILTGIAAPLGSTIATEFYAAGEGLLIDTQQNVVTQIQDEEVRNALNSSFTTAKDSATTNIQVSNSIFQYGWLFILILVAIVLFLVTRQTVGFNRVI